MNTAERLSVSLPFARPLDARSLLVFLAAHEVDGLDRTDLQGMEHTRSISTTAGPAIVTVAFRPDAVVLTSLDEFQVEDAIEARVKKWLSLDTDTSVIEAHLSMSPVLAPLVAKRPGLRFLGSMNPFESAVMTVLGQHVSLGAARRFGSRLVAAYGERICTGMVAFPSAQSLSLMRPEDIQRSVGVTGARARTIVALANGVADATIDLRSDGDGQKLSQQLLALPGVGPWTADYIAIRVLGDGDGFLGGDLVLRKALGGKTAKEAEALAESWRPYRAYAMLHLWTETALHGD